MNKIWLLTSQDHFTSTSDVPVRTDTCTRDHCFHSAFLLVGQVHTSLWTAQDYGWDIPQHDSYHRELDALNGYFQWHRISPKCYFQTLEAWTQLRISFFYVLALDLFTKADRAELFKFIKSHCTRPRASCQTHRFGRWRDNPDHHIHPSRIFCGWGSGMMAPKKISGDVLFIHVDHNNP